jgi:hypothetical protein
MTTVATYAPPIAAPSYHAPPPVAPAPIHKWIKLHGGLTRTPIFHSGRKLAGMIGGAQPRRTRETVKRALNFSG